MRILFATNAMPVAGIEINLLLLSCELARLGHQVTVVSSGGPLVSSFVDAGIEHVVCPMSLTSPVHVARSALAFRRIVEARESELIHFFSASAAVIGRTAQVLPGRRPWPSVVSSVMGLENSPDESRFITNLRNYLCTLGADRILIISPVIGRLVRALPIRAARIVDRKVVGVNLAFADHVDDAMLERLRDELHVGTDTKVVLTVGALAPRKSHELFIRAAKEVIAAFPNVLFVVVGEGPLRSSLHDEIRKLGLGDKVKLIGQRRDVAALLKITDVYVKPGIVEGFIGITVLEAQAVGCPVVAFETEDVKLAIEEGVTGLLVPLGHVHDLATAILHLLKHPDRAAAIAAAGRSKVEAEFGIDAVTLGLLAEYRTVIDSRRSA